MSPWHRLEEPSTGNTEETDNRKCAGCGCSRGKAVTVTVLLAVIGGLSVVGVILGMRYQSHKHNDASVASPAHEDDVIKYGKSAFVTQAPTHKTITATTPKNLSAVVQDLLNDLDTDIDPCDDFYGFVCNKWAERHQVSEKDPYKMPDTRLQKELPKKLRYAVENLHNKQEPVYLSLVRNFYKSCANLESIDKSHVAPFRDWPTLNPNWTPDTFDIEQRIVDTNKLMHESGVIVTITADRDIMDTQEYQIYLLEPTLLGLGKRERYPADRSSETYTWYEQYITNVSMVFGANPTVAARDAKDIVDLDMKLASYTSTLRQRVETPTGDFFRKLTVGQLARNFGSRINWKRLINLMLELVDMTVGEATELRVRWVSYFWGLQNVLKETPTRTLANYLTWRLVEYQLKAMPEEYRLQKDMYEQVTLLNPPERWEYCVEQTKAYFGHLLGRLYVDRYFSKEERKAVTDMVHNVKEGLRELIRETEWMDQTTTNIAIKKLEKIKPVVGYPDFIYNNTVLSALYKGLSCSKNDYRGNLQKAQDHQNKLVFNLYKAYHHRTYSWDSYSYPWQSGKIVDVSSKIDPITMNAEYKSTANSIVLAAAFLSHPTYDRNYLESMNYGRTGFVIGHELTHGFDSTGRLYDAEGNLDDWWSYQSESAYKRKSSCLVRQYNRTWNPIVNHTLNGELTLAENIADNGGIKAAFKGYQYYERLHGVEQQRSNYSSEQLFFINFARFFCTNITEREAKYFARSDTHSANHFRVKIPLSNYEEFGKAFKCRRGSVYYPHVSKTCEVW